MARKRTPKPPTDEPQRPAAPATVEPQAAEQAAPTPPLAPPLVEAADPIPSFAERVGPKKVWPAAADPFAVAADALAGVRLFESRRDRQMAIQFADGRAADKPSRAVIDTMKEAGYRWNPSDRVWAHPVRPESARGTRIEAERLYQEVCTMIRQEKGVESGPEIPF